MDTILQFGKHFKTRYLIVVLVIWWLAMLVAYSIITFRVNNLNDKLRESGVKITNEFSNLISLPLLERNSESIHKLLTDASSRMDVVYAAVVDHRNKVIAFTGMGHLMPDKTETTRSVEKVSMWEGGFLSHSKILNFVSDITYAGTKIGEIFIGLSTPKSFQTRKQFIIFAFSSCLILLLLIAGFRYPSIRTFAERYLSFNRPHTERSSIVKKSFIICPFCGTQKSLSDKFFKPSSPDKFIVTEASEHASIDGNVASAKSIDLRELARTEDFSEIKRRIILRCTEIIKKLAI